MKAERAIGFSDMSRFNRITVLNLIKKHKQISRKDLAHLTKLTEASVSRIIAELIAKGLVAEVGTGESQGGRKPVLLEFKSDAYYVLGIAFHSGHVRMAITDLNGTIILRSTQGVREDEQQTAIAAAVAAGAGEFIASSGLPSEKFIGVGVAVPGLVDSHTGIIRYSAPLGWRNLPMGSILSDAIGLPTRVDNISRAVTLAKKLLGEGEGCQNLVYMYVGDGVGAGIVVNGQLYYGSKYSAAEIGHTIIDINGPKCRCGKRGCLETLASQVALIERYCKYTGAADSNMDLTTIVANFDNGDEKAVQAVEETIYYLGIGVANIVNTFNPELVIIDGWPPYFPSMLERLKQVIYSYTMEGLADELGIIFSRSEDATLAGAVALVLNDFFDPTVTQSDDRCGN
ncbi:ROK family transcriptional regulator [Moorellaceae bacterium AZ2]